MSKEVSTFSTSYEKLTELRNTAQARSSDSLKLALPEPPIDTPSKARQYLNGAISMLAESSAHSLYPQTQLDHISEDLRDTKRAFYYKFNGAQHRFERFHQGLENVEKDIEGIDEDLKEIREDLKEVHENFKEVKEDLKDVKEDLKEDLKGVKEDIRFLRNDVGEISALARNRLVTRLIHPIEEVRAFVKDENGVLQCLVAPDFPLTVKSFWLLSSNVPALQRLAKHYDLKGWQHWNVDDSQTGEATEYVSIDVAVSSHPGLCLQLLALKWGLEYRKLERPGPKGLDMTPPGQKRKANDGSESPRVRHKLNEASMSSGDKGKVLGQGKSSSKTNQSPETKHSFESNSSFEAK